jgi:alpha-ribazole phosphatase/probable phosphoglycerate mutase
MKVYFITHSTSNDNEAGLSSGWKDVQLSKIGIQQAKEMGVRFGNIDLDLICCSDLIRAVETVRIAFGETIPVNTDRRLREINYGDFNGKPIEMIDPINEKWIRMPFPNGESYEQAIARIHDFCRELRSKHSERKTLIVGHRATRLGLDTFTGNLNLEECLRTSHDWQPYWEYEF